jgi:hypothetical protein
MSLRSPNLIPEWGTLAVWLAERRRFREDVTSWDKAGRRADRLYDRPRLEEIWHYHDRNRLERKFADASRDRLRRRNEWNRVLKWVFLGLAVAILVGWITAWIYYHQAKKEARAAEEANATLSQKQQLTNIRLFVRGLGELASAHNAAQRMVAKARWDAQLAQFRKEPQFSPFLDLNMEKLRQCAICKEGPTEISPGDLAEIRRLRNSVLANEQLLPVLLSMRAVSYDMVELSARQAVAGLKTDKPSYSEVEPFAREFWTQYWGDMLLVEGREVEAAMAGFSQTLAKIRDEAEQPVPDQTETALKQCSRDKGKQLAQEFPRLWLNVGSFAQVDQRARELNISEGDRARLQERLCQIRKERVSRPVTNRQLVSELERKLPPLLAALKAEKQQPTIPPYPDAAAK